MKKKKGKTAKPKKAKKTKKVTTKDAPGNPPKCPPGQVC